jgi:tetratricopeptide (TPR) repeat protein
VEWIEFSPDGEWVLSGTKGEARVWEVRTGQPITPPLFPRNGTLRYAVFGDEGRAVFLIDGANVVSVFPLEANPWNPSDLDSLTRILGDHRLETTSEGASFLVNEVPRDRIETWGRLSPRYQTAFVQHDRNRWHTLCELESARVNDWHAALFHRTRIPSGPRVTPDALSRTADYHRKSGQYPEAVAAYSKVIVANPQSAEALVGRGQSYLQQGRPIPARADLTKAIELRPDDWQAYYHLAFAHVLLDDWDRTIQSLHQALDRGGIDDTKVWELLAIAHLMNDDPAGYI